MGAGVVVIVDVVVVHDYLQRHSMSGVVVAIVGVRRKHPWRERGSQLGWSFICGKGAPKYDFAAQAHGRYHQYGTSTYPFGNVA